MNTLIAWFAQNRVAANLLMLIILVLGSSAIGLTKKEILPNIEWDLFTVSVIYPQASPTQVEAQILKPLETALSGIDGVRNMVSYAREGIGTVQLQVELFSPRGHDRVSDAIEARLSTVNNLPAGASVPTVKQAQVRDLVGTLVIHGQADDRTLINLAANIKDDLLADGVISHIETQNAKAQEVRVELDELAMQRYAVAFTQVVQALKQQASGLATGEVNTESGAAAIVTGRQLDTKEAIEDTFVTSFDDGARVRIRDLARVVEGYAESGAYLGEFNGEPAVYLSVYRRGSQSLVKVAQAINAYQANPGVFIPEGLSLSVWQDLSRYFISRVDLLVENAVTGLLMLGLILLLFLSLRLSFWVALGIPVAFMGAFAVLLYTGSSINMISLFAFVLVLGIVVDDAIIVGENIYTHQSRGALGVLGAIRGAQGVSVPVVFAALTTIVMFLPMLFLPGSEGKLVRAIPIVVISILVFSLIESLLILPAHLASQNAPSSHKQGPRFAFAILEPLQRRIRNGLEYFVSMPFKSFVNHVLAWRYAYQALFLGLFMISLALFQGGWLKTAFFSTIEADFSVAVVHMPVGTPQADTVKAVEQIQAGAQKLQAVLAQNQGLGRIKHIVTSLGQGAGQTGSHVGQVVIELAPEQARALTGEQLNQRWRELTGHIPNALYLSFDATLNRPGPNINIKLLAESPTALAAATQALKRELAGYSGVYDIQDSSRGMKQEIHIHPRPVAQDLGLQMESIAQQVSAAFAGVEVMQILRGDTRVSVKVEYPEQKGGALWRLENMLIYLPSGAPVPLVDVADVSFVKGPAALRRTNGLRDQRVTAYVNEAIASTETIQAGLKAQFLNRLEAQHPGVTWVPAGAQRAQGEFIGRLAYLYFIALAIMYALMAVLFKSYFQPLMIMYAIPFGILGAVAGHLLIGLEVTLWSLVGICAVSGVVVNDNLVLVDLINRKVRAGIEVKNAIVEAAAERFRPIMLTTVTTFFGLIPLMLERSVQAQFLVPMCVSLAFGVIFATLVTLILVPCTYQVLNDINPRRPQDAATGDCESEHPNTDQTNQATHSMRTTANKGIEAVLEY